MVKKVSPQSIIFLQGAILGFLTACLLLVFLWLFAVYSMGVQLSPNKKVPKVSSTEEVERNIKQLEKLEKASSSSPVVYAYVFEARNLIKRLGTGQDNDLRNLREKNI